MMTIIYQNLSSSEIFTNIASPYWWQSCKNMQERQLKRKQSLKAVQAGGKELVTGIAFGPPTADLVFLMSEPSARSEQHNSDITKYHSKSFETSS